MSSEMPVFETKRLILRGVTKQDIPSYEKNFIDYEVIKELSAAVPWPYPENGIQEFLEKMVFPFLGKEQWFWGIFEKENPEELIGAVQLFLNGKPENRGFWLGKKYWGKGYMTEAVTPVIDFAFSAVGFEKLILANAVGNVKSRRVKEKTGARLLEVIPGKYVNPNYTHQEIWELKKVDWVKWRENFELRKN